MDELEFIEVYEVIGNTTFVVRYPLIKEGDIKVIKDKVKNLILSNINEQNISII